MVKLFEIASSNLETIAQTIKNDCKQYLQEINNQPTKYILYRGKGRSEAFFKKEKGRDVNTERTPVTTPKVLHKKLNELFVKKFGWPARNGVFTTSNRELAKDYSDHGIPHVFFPIGKYKYVWHPEVDDLFGYLAELDVAEGGLNIEEVSDEELKQIVSEYRDTDLISAIEHNSEVAFNVDSYYILRDTEKGRKVLQILEDML